MIASLGRLMAGPVLGLAVALLAGCANSGVTSRAVESIAGGLADAELYHAAKVASDADQRANLRDAWHAVADLEARLTIETAAAGKDAIPKAIALEVSRQMSEDLRAASAKLETIAERQAAAEVHYQGLRGTLRATVGLVRALADRETAEQEAQARTIEAGAAAADAAKRLGIAGATGGAVR